MEINADSLFPTYFFEFPLPTGLIDGDPEHDMIKSIPGRLLVSRQTYHLIANSANGIFGVHLNIDSFYGDFENFDTEHSDGFYLGYRLYCLDIHPYNYLDTLFDIVTNKFEGQGYSWAVIHAPLSMAVYPL